jgi:hypothetical protein
VELYLHFTVFVDGKHRENYVEFTFFVIKIQVNSTVCRPSVFSFGDDVPFPYLQSPQQFRNQEFRGYFDIGADYDRNPKARYNF